MSSINQLGRRTCAELQNLKIIKFDQEHIEDNLETNIRRELEYIKKSTPVTQIERRFYEDLNGLLFEKIQFTKERGHIIAKGLRTEKPIKIYKQKCKMVKKYNLKIKH